MIIEFEAVVVNTSDNTLGVIWANDFSVDLNNDGTDDIRFTFTDPLPTGTGATDSEILFNIEGTTAWTAETTMDATRAISSAGAVIVAS